MIQNNLDDYRQVYLKDLTEPQSGHYALFCTGDDSLVTIVAATTTLDQLSSDERKIYLLGYAHAGLPKAEVSCRQTIPVVKPADDGYDIAVSPTAQHWMPLFNIYPLAGDSDHQRAMAHLYLQPVTNLMVLAPSMFQVCHLLDTMTNTEKELPMILTLAKNCLRRLDDGITSNEKKD